LLWLCWRWFLQIICPGWLWTKILLISGPL
jgi:hypothetical protein